MLNRNDEGYAPSEIDANIRPFIQQIKQYEKGFMLLTEKFEKNPDQEALKGKFSDLLSDLWKTLDGDEGKPFITIDHLENVVGRRIKDNIVKKKEMQVKAQNDQAQQPAYEPNPEDDAEGGAGNDYAQEKAFEKELNKLKELEEVEKNEDGKQTDGLSQSDYLTSVQCFIDKSLKKFTREEFQFALIRQQMSSQIHREGEVFDKNQDQIGRFANQFKILWNVDENDFDGSVEPGAEGEGGDDDGDD